MTVYLAEYTEGEPVVQEVILLPGNKTISFTLGGETWVRIKNPIVVKWLTAKLERKDFGLRKLFQNEGIYLSGRWHYIRLLLKDPPTKIGKIGIEIEVPQNCRELWEPSDARGLKGIIEIIREAINKAH